jgi:hypothetical protein
MKKITALIVCFILSLYPFLNASALFVPRETAPEETNEFYYSNKNIFYKLGYGMPNCTAYAFGRAYEILGEEPKLTSGSAFRWFNYNKNGGFYPFGDIPKLGAIACFGGNTANPNGHVAVIEKIQDGYAHLSNSSWGGYLFRVDLKKLNAWDTAYKVGGEYLPFEGFIYIYDEVEEERYDFIKTEEGTVITLFYRLEKEVTLPSVLNEDTVTGVGACVFLNDSTVNKIVLPNTILTVGEKAFSGCENLTQVVIPESVTKIYDNAFENSKNVVVHCKKNSYAHTFCKENEILFDLGILFGDVYKDESVDIFDLIALAKHIVSAESEIAFDEADMDLNNTVDIFDLINLAKMIVKV